VSYYFILFKAEVTALFGTRPVMEAASQYDKKFLSSELIEPIDLKDICEQVPIL
jgi:hypothetical protein